MEAFDERTGIVGPLPPTRYLWTDAFAVCNHLELHRARPEAGFLGRAQALVDQVHEVLGAYALNDAREGWLGGMDDDEHRRSPTKAGLRIGKSSPERSPGEPFEERAEWNLDGQYFHYLTRWMHALERMAESTGEAQYHRWAFELAQAAFDGFVHRPTDGRPLRMHWKMSVDLDRPLVSSMGHHDALDGWVMARVLFASTFADDEERRELAALASTYREMLAGRDLASGDALGIGGLLVDAWQLFRILPADEEVTNGNIAELLDAADLGLDYVLQQGQLDAPPVHRLGFRELGLSIGLHAAGRMIEQPPGQSECQKGRIDSSLARISSRFALADRIERTWVRPENRQFPAWKDHRDINEVMLATTLVPDGYLGPAPRNDQ